MLKKNLKKNNSKNFRIRYISKKDNEIDILLKSIKAFGIIAENFNEDFNESSIINNEIENQNLLIKWIEDKINKKVNKFDLIFKMSKNGSKGSDFHNYCDNQGSTLILVKTSENKIIGGFTPLNWEKGKGSLIDESGQTFIFSLNLMKKYELIDQKIQAIYGTTNNGPSFGKGQFELLKNMKNGELTIKGNFPINNELTNGKDNLSFETEEFEVYKVLY